MGPPGTGKTLLARAVAGEAGVPFSLFPVPTLWRCLSVSAPLGCAICLTRRRRIHRVSSLLMKLMLSVANAVLALAVVTMNVKQTLNQLLVEMDGFGANEGGHHDCRDKPPGYPLIRR